MALLDLAVRISTVMALRGKTYVGQNVFDEPGDPIADILEGGVLDDATRRACIAVYTSASDNRPDHNDYLAGDRELELTLQTYLPDQMTIDGNVVDTRRSGGKLVLDLIERQIERVFLIDQSPWAVLRRKFQFTLHAVRTQSFLIRSGTADVPGPTIAAREMVWSMDTLAEPNFGTPVPAPWNELIALLEATPELSPLASVISAEITAPDGAPSWQRAQAALGLLNTTPALIGINTIDPLPPEDTPPAIQVTVTDENTDSSVVIDLDTPEDQP